MVSDKKKLIEIALAAVISMIGAVLVVQSYIYTRAEATSLEEKVNKIEERIERRLERIEDQLNKIRESLGS